MSGMGAMTFDDPEKLLRDLKALELEWPRLMGSMAAEGAERLAAMAAERTPPLGAGKNKGWKTGSIRKAGSRISVDVYHPDPAAARVEYGSQAGGRNEPGRFMLALALSRMEKEWPVSLEAALAALLSGKREAGTK